MSTEETNRKRKLWRSLAVLAVLVVLAVAVGLIMTRNNSKIEVDEAMIQQFAPAHDIVFELLPDNMLRITDRQGDADAIVTETSLKGKPAKTVFIDWIRSNDIGPKSHVVLKTGADTPYEVVLDFTESMSELGFKDAHIEGNL